MIDSATCTEVVDDACDEVLLLLSLLLRLTVKDSSTALVPRTEKLLLRRWALGTSKQTDKKNYFLAFKIQIFVCFTVSWRVCTWDTVSTLDSGNIFSMILSSLCGGVVSSSSSSIFALCLRLTLDEHFDLPLD